MVAAGTWRFTTWRLLAMVVVSVALVAAIVRVAGTPCEWGTFAYRAWLETPQGAEGPAAVVLVEGDERVILEPTPVGSQAIFPGEMALSPDGREVAFEKMRGTLDDEYGIDESLGLFVYDIDGSDERRISERETSDLDWSSDGERIAYLNGGEIGVMDAEGGDERTIFRMPRSDLVDPPVLTDLEWSAGSDRIAFIVEHSGKRSRSEIWTMDPSGGDRRREVVVEEGFPSHLAWSPDGERFAFDAFWKGVPSVVIAEASGGRLRQVEPNSDYPAWSKDGSRLAYVIGHEGHYDPRIVVGDSDGQGETAVPVPGDAVGIERLDDWASC